MGKTLIERIAALEQSQINMQENFNKLSFDYKDNLTHVSKKLESVEEKLSIIILRLTTFAAFITAAQVIINLFDIKLAKAIGII